MAAKTWRPKPPTRKGAPIQLHTFGDKEFERLCSELFEKEPNIDGCDIYGVPGQGQLGIDLIAREINGVNIQVGQCKCHREFSTKKIKGASEKFFEYWTGNWSPRGVTRFILFLACEVEETQTQDEIDRQREFFAVYGIKYEVWPASRILKKLRPYTGIVSSYFEPAEYWVQLICGQSLDYPRTMTAAVIYQNEQFSAVLAGTVENTVVSIKEAWQEGRREDARALLRQARGNDATFSALPRDLQARLLRFEAIDRLERGAELSEAEEIARRAAAIDASGPGAFHLDALLKLRNDDPAGALALLADLQDLDSIHLRASILLRLDRVSDATGLLSQIDEQVATAETHRLRALRHLASQDVTTALLEAQKAVELQPRWTNSIFLLACVEYLTSLALPPRQLPTYPDPVPWDLIRRDDQTLDRLVHAESLFNQLLQGRDLERLERDALEIWRLACVANHPSKQDEAAFFCHGIIRSRPAREQGVSWAIVRNFDINLDGAETALKGAINSGQADVNQIFALVAIYCQRRQWRKAERVLEQRRESLLPHGESIFLHWKAQVLALDGRPMEAISFIDQSAARGDLLSLRAKLIAALPEMAQSRREALRECDDLYKKTGAARYLLDACTVAEALRDWAFIADHAEELLNAIGTAELVRPAASATFNAGRPEACLELLDKSARLFPGGKLPTELRRLRIACQQATGAIPQALVEAEELAHDEPTLEHLLGLAQVQFSKGDFRCLSIVARDLLRRPGLQAESALRLSWQTQWEDLRLARDLWHHAADQGIPDSAVIPAIRLGYALGLDDELGPLTKRMEELGRAGTAGIQTATIEQLIEHTRRFQQHAAELNRLYSTAQAPIHAIAEQLNISLAEVYHGNIERCLEAEDLSEQTALMARYAGKQVRDRADSAGHPWRIHMDITALLLAHDLDVLPIVERQFRPVKISRYAIPSLVAMRDHLTINQPRRVAAAQEIFTSRQSEKLAVTAGSGMSVNTECTVPPPLRGDWQALLSRAESTSGYLVDFIPIPAGGQFINHSELPPEVQARVINCRTIIEALRLHGPLGDEEYKAALARLGSESQKPLFAVPRPEAHLYFHGTTIELLSTSGVLSHAIEKFRCHITAAEDARVQAELRSAQSQIQLGEWVANLIDRVSRGIDEGVYEIIPGTEPSHDADGRENTDLACLVSLLTVPAEDRNVLWIDDRWANRHLRGGSVPIVDAVDVLRTIRAAGGLSDAEYYTKLSRLRAGNVWFLPLETSEVLWHLNNASVNEYGVVETVGLKALRRGIAACILRCNLLQKPTDQQAASGNYEEFSYLLSFNHAVTDAIAEIWKANETLDTRVARSDWLLRNLYVDLHVLKLLDDSHPNASDIVSLTASRFALLISKLFSMPLGASSEERNREYVRWLVHRILARPLRDEAGLSARTADIVKRMFLDIAPATIRSQRARMIMALLHRYLRLVPDSIQEALNRDPEFASRLKLRFTMVVEVAEHRFQRGPFLKAVCAAVNGRQEVVEDLSQKAKFTVHRASVSRSNCSVFIERQTTPSEAFEIQEVLFGMLQDSPSAREEFLRAQQHLFDMRSAEFARFVAEVASTEDPDRRMRRLEEERANSGSYYYQQLYQDLSRRDGFDRRDMLPHETILLRHYRVSGAPGRTSVATVMTEGVTDLLGTEALLDVLQRLARLPIPLPESVHERISSLPRTDRRNLIKGLLRFVGSPVSQWHLIAILRASNVKSEARLAERIARRSLVPSAGEEFAAYKAVLVWCVQEFKSWQSLSTGMRLMFAWAHAHQVFVFFKAMGASLEWIRDCFDKLDDRAPFGSVEADSKLRADVSHPIHLTREVLLLGGLAYAFLPSESGSLPERLAELFWALAIKQTEFGPFPALQLLLDSRVTTDELGSFFGGDRHSKLLSVIPLEHRDVVSSIVAESTLERTLTALEEHHQEAGSWSRLYLVLGTSPVPPEHVRRVIDIMMHADFAIMATDDVAAGPFALHIASSYAKHIADEAVRQYLGNALVATATVLARRDPDAEVRERVLLLMDTALNIAQCAPLEGKTMDEFSKLVTQLVQVWPVVGSVAKPGIQRLCEEVSISQSEGLWRLNLKLRCRS